MSRGSNAPRKYTGCMVFLILLMLVFIGGTVFMGWLCYNLVNGDPISREEIDLPGVFLPEQDPSEETEETVPGKQTGHCRGGAGAGEGGVNRYDRLHR